MQYLVENKNKFITRIFPIFSLLYLGLGIWLLKEDTHVNLYFLLYLLLPISIYIFFTKSYKGYIISSFLQLTVFGFISQMIGLYGTLHTVYPYDIFYYFLLFFIIFYLFFIVDLVKINKISKKSTIDGISKIKKVRIKRDGIYYIDMKDMLHNFKDKPSFSNNEIGFMSFYTIKIAIILGIPFILLGKFAVAFGIIAARYFPDSVLIPYTAFFILGAVFFPMTFLGLLSSLKLKLDDE